MRIQFKLILLGFAVITVLMVDNISTGGIIVSVLLVIGMGVIVSRQVTKPLADLRDVVDSVAKGDITKRAEVRGKDEIGELARAFNSMMDSVAEEEGLRAQIIDSLPGSLFLLDTKGNIELINPAVEALLGYKKSDVVGKPISVAFPTTTTTVLSNIGLDELLEKGVLHGKALSMRTQNGEEIPVMLYGRTIEDTTGGKRAVLVALDRRTEKAYVEKRLAPIVPVLQAVASGDFSTDIAVEGEDEFTALCVALNLMIADVRVAHKAENEKASALKHQNRNLELKSDVLEDTKKALSKTFDELRSESTALKDTKTELTEKITELERFNKLAVGRELKMVELKQEIARLNGRKQP